MNATILPSTKTNTNLKQERPPTPKSNQVNAQKTNERKKALYVFLERQKKVRKVDGATGSDVIVIYMKYFNSLKSYSLLDGSGQVVRKNTYHQSLLRCDR
mmetsp:Transcript_57186/g.66859  ORF Transcript_57186/g.66859 Transcript_57186/m.66859 type:complete len:100 (-) Transcript_57186:574-873(-)